MVDGHELHEEDLRLMYTFDQNSGSAVQYEAHSDSQVRLKYQLISFTFDSEHYSRIKAEHWICFLNLNLKIDDRILF